MATGGIFAFVHLLMLRLMSCLKSDQQSFAGGQFDLAFRRNSVIPIKAIAIVDWLELLVFNRPHCTCEGRRCSTPE